MSYRMNDSYNKNNFKHTQLNKFYAQCSVEIYLVVPIDFHEGNQIQLRVGAKRVITVPGTLDENTHILVYNKDQETQEKTYIRDYVPVTSCVDEEQIVDLNRFLTEHGYSFQELDAKTYALERRRKRKFFPLDIRKNGIFDGRHGYGEWWSHSGSADFFKGVLKLNDIEITRFYALSNSDSKKDSLELAADYLENKEAVALEDLLFLFQGKLHAWGFYTENGCIAYSEIFPRSQKITMNFKEGIYQYEINNDQITISLCKFLCSILKCKSLESCRNTENKAKVLGII